MIGFLQPLVLIGLAAAAIPPLLHLIGRRLPPTVVFPAVRYLTATEREHSRRLKLRNLLLLILRTAIIVLVVLAAARPVARVGTGNVHPPTALALIVDNSMSSGAVVGGRRVLDVLVDRAQRVLARVASADRLWLVLADAAPRRMGRAQASQLLDSLTSWPVRMDLGVAVRTAARTVAEAGLEAHEVVVLSDLQSSALSSGDPPAARVLVMAAPDVPENRSVDSASAEPAVWTPEGAVVVGVNGSPASPVAVRLSVDSRGVAQALASPGDRVILAGPVSRSGWYAATVELDPDELRADDRRWLALHVVEPAAVRAASGAGEFVREAVEVLQEGGRAERGDEVVLGDRLEGDVAVVFPPDDPALLGAVNRGLAGHAIDWRFGALVEGEWTVAGDVGPAAGAAVFQRYQLEGAGGALARVGGEPWLVRQGSVVIIGSRMEEAWTLLPVSAGFVPFLDLLINGVGAHQSRIVSATPGEVVEVPPGPDAILLPGGPTAVPVDRRVAVPLDPGVYFLTGRADTVGAIVVNHDPRESRLEVAARSEIRSSLGSDVQVLGDGALDRELFRGARRADLTGVLLTAALLAVLLELAVATLGARPSRNDAADAD